MALQDFYGTYEIQCSAAADCGLFTQVEVAWNERYERIEVTFRFEHREPDVFTNVQYLPSSDALHIPLESPLKGMWISRFFSTLDDYRAIYGIVVIEDRNEKIRRSPVWSAELTIAGSGHDEPVVDPTPADAFLGRYDILTTTDVQFGMGSLLSLTEVLEPTPSMQLTILNALDQVVVADFGVTYDPDSVSITGNSEQNDYPSDLLIRTTLSVAFVEGETFTYGLVLLGDPEQGGTFGGEEETPIPREEPLSPRSRSRSST